jgi:uncharacterized protein (TIGR00369 family)
VSIVDIVKASKAAGDPDALSAAIPYARFLGLGARVVEGELITTMRFAPHLVGNPSIPALHGGTLGALLESAAIFELMWGSETVLLPKTITLTVDYLRSGAAVDTHARGVVTRLGRRVANVHVEAWQDDRARPIATAHAHFLVMREEAAADKS